MSQRNDDEYQWLLDNGAPPLQINDMWFYLLRLWGYTGSLDDMKHDYWAAGGTPPIASRAFDSGFDTGFG